MNSLNTSEKKSFLINIHELKFTDAKESKVVKPSTLAVEHKLAPKEQDKPEGVSNVLKKTSNNASNVETADNKGAVAKSKAQIKAERRAKQVRNSKKTGLQGGS